MADTDDKLDPEVAKQLAAAANQEHGEAEFSQDAKAGVSVAFHIATRIAGYYKALVANGIEPTDAMEMTKAASNIYWVHWLDRK